MIQLPNDALSASTPRQHFADRARWPCAGRRRGAGAKTLVYCSEGSPENFYPGVNTTGTSFDANEPDLQPPRRVRARRHQGRAGPGREAGTSRPTALIYTFNLRKGVKWHNHRDFKPTRDFNADDVHLHVRAAVEGGQPVLQGHELQPLVLQRHGHAQAAEVGREGRRLHGQDHAEQARGAVPGQPGDGLRRRPVEGIRRRDAQGRHAREDRPGADRHRPVLPGAVPEGRGHPLQGLPAVLGRQGQDRRPGVRDHARRLGALGQAAEGRVPRHALPEPGRPRRDPQGRRTCRCSSSPA